jgi:nicotinamide-nucleotide amidase
MKSCILAIGDEIVGGMTVDSNSAFLAEAFRAVGVEPLGGFSVADDEDAIVRAFERALEDADVVVSTGGLGPTTDDLTTACVARLAGRDLRLDEESLRRLEERFLARGGSMPENNRKQAYFPEGSEIIPNARGTAPGFICPVERGGRTRYVACLPGVPHEMKAMVRETLVPWIAARSPDRRFASRIFNAAGLGESKLDELLTGVVAPDEARLAYRAAFPRLQARVTVSGAPGDDLEGRLDDIEARVRERAGGYIYALGDEGMEETVGKLLTGRGLTLAVAESCTGGLIGHRLTDVPGSSGYFLLGIVAYSNDAKQRLLGVREETLVAHGAVSVETAEEMAEGARRAAGADIGLATTGIAGPGGGSAEKPVGTVCIGLAWEGGRWSKRLDMGSREREWIKAMTAQQALDRLRHHLLDPGGSAAG